MGDSRRSLFRFGEQRTGNCSGGIIRLLSLAVLVGLFSRRWRWHAIAAYALAFAGLIAWWSGIAPSNDRHWKPEVAKLPLVSIDGDRITIRNIRNFSYRTETDYTVAYYDKTFDLAGLESVDLIAVYWGSPAIAHMMVSFNFGADDHLDISIERRDEIGESYSTVKGLFKQYELFYVVADERDVIRLRTNVRVPREDVYVYRLKGPIEDGRRLFLEYIKEIDSLATRPEFYNTVATNCTGNIWLHSQVNPGRRAVFLEDPGERIRARISLRTRQARHQSAVSRASAAESRECRRAGGRPGRGFFAADPRGVAGVRMGQAPFPRKWGLTPFFTTASATAAPIAR